MHRALTIQKKPVPIVLGAVEFASCRLILRTAALSMLQWRRAREVCSWINQFCGRSEPGNSNLEQFRRSAFLLSSQKKGKTHNWPLAVETQVPTALEAAAVRVLPGSSAFAEVTAEKP